MATPVYRVELTSPLDTVASGQASALTAVIIGDDSDALELYDAAGNDRHTTAVSYTELIAGSGIYRAIVYLAKGTAGTAVMTWTGTPSYPQWTASIAEEPGALDAFAQRKLAEIGSIPSQPLSTDLASPTAFTMFRRERRDFSVQAINPSGTARDLDGVDLVMIGKLDLDDVLDDAGAVLIKTQALGDVTIEDAENGRLSWHLEPADTSDMTKFPAKLVESIVTIFWAVKDLTTELIVARGTLDVYVPAANQV